MAVINLEFTFDFNTEDKRVLLKVTNEAMFKTEQEVPGLVIQKQNVFIPYDAPVVVWKMVVDGRYVDGLRKSLPFWFRYYTAKAGYLPEKAQVVLAEEMKVRGISPDTLPKPAKLFG